jgi:hypothetical protein
MYFKVNIKTTSFSSLPLSSLAFSSLAFFTQRKYKIQTRLITGKEGNLEIRRM